jgi:hypothetical protein
VRSLDRRLTQSGMTTTVLSVQDGTPPTGRAGTDPKANDAIKEHTTPNSAPHAAAPSPRPVASAEVGFGAEAFAGAEKIGRSDVGERAIC